MKRKSAGRKVAYRLLKEAVAAKDPTAIIEHAVAGHRTGQRKIVRLLDEVARDSGQRHLRTCLMVALGIMDTYMGHRALSRWARAPDPDVRADALEGIAFEKQYFDEALVLSFFRSNVTDAELLSALYALQFWGFAAKRFHLARHLIRPLLDHDNVNVQSFAVEALAESPSNQRLLRRLQDHPSEAVRSAATERLAWRFDP
jgi:hypothetical protein